MKSEKFMKKWEEEREHGPRMYMCMNAVQFLFVVHMLVIVSNLATKQKVFYNLHWSLPYLVFVMGTAVVGMAVSMILWKQNEKAFKAYKAEQPTANEALTHDQV